MTEHHRERCGPADEPSVRRGVDPAGAAHRHGRRHRPLIIVGVAVAISAYPRADPAGQPHGEGQRDRAGDRSGAARLQRHPSTGRTAHRGRRCCSAGRQEPGVMLVLSSRHRPRRAAPWSTATAPSWSSTAQQIDELVGGRDAATAPLVVTIDGLGEYRVDAYQLADLRRRSSALPLSDVAGRHDRARCSRRSRCSGSRRRPAAARRRDRRGSSAPDSRRCAPSPTRRRGSSKLPLDRARSRSPSGSRMREADPRTEVGRVGEALNTLLDHVDESLDARQRNEERMRRFVADASHELRTPLASIRGYSELSLRAARRRATTRSRSRPTESSLDRIQAQSLRMTTLVEDLLLLARLDEGQELVYGSVDLIAPRDRGGRRRPAGRPRPQLGARRRRGARRRSRATPAGCTRSPRICWPTPARTRRPAPR